MKTPNYTAEMTARLVEEYQNGMSVDDLANMMDKSVRSVRSKLVREGVYVAQPKKSARKADEPTKKELLLELEQVAPISVDGLMGATKEAINELLSHFQKAS